MQHAVTCDDQPGVCHQNAQCLYSSDEGRQKCVCNPGTVGDGYADCHEEGCLSIRIWRKGTLVDPKAKYEKRTLESKTGKAIISDPCLEVSMSLVNILIHFWMSQL